MDEVLQPLKVLAKSRRVLQPDQTIEIALAPFASTLPDTLTEEEAANIEKVFINVLNSSAYVLSPPCCIYIGLSMVEIYRRVKNNKFWNLISTVTNHPNSNNIIAISIVIKKFGSNSRSSLTALTQHLLSLKDPLKYPALIALRSIFKVCGDVVSKLAESAYSFAKSQLRNNNPTVQVAASRLLRALLPFKSQISIRQFRNVVETALEKAHDDFAKDSAATLAGAFCARELIGRKIKSSDDDFKVEAGAKRQGNRALEYSLQLVKLYMDDFKLVFRKFLDQLEPEFVYRNAETLFTFAFQNNKESIKDVTAFFGSDIRSLLFKKMLQAKNPNLMLLKEMTFDADSARDTAGVSLKKLWSNSLADRNTAASFLISLSLSYPEVALEHLHMAAQFVSNPPAEGGNFLRQYNGMANVIAIVLAVIQNQSEAFEANKELIFEYIKFTQKKADNDQYAISLLYVLSSLDSSCIDVEIVEPILKRFRAYISKLVREEPSQQSRVNNEFVLANLAFLARHTVENISNLTGSLIKLMPRFSLPCIVYVLKVMLKTGFYAPGSFLNFIGHVPQSCIDPAYISYLTPLMKTANDYLDPPVYEPINQNGLLYTDDTKILGQAILGLLPKLFWLVDEKEAIRILITALNEKSIVYRCALVEVYQTKAASTMPANFHMTMLQKMMKLTDRNEIQLLSECIAYHVYQYPEAYNDVAQFLERYSTSSSLFLEVAVAQKIQITDDQLALSLARIQRLANDPSTLPEVFYALAIIYESKSPQLTYMQIGDAQCQLLLNAAFRCTDAASFLGFGICLDRLIPIVAPFASEENGVGFLKLLLGVLYTAPYHYTREFFYKVVHSAIAFVPSLVDVFEMSYPTARSSTIELRLSVAGALADASKRRESLLPDSSLIPILLVLLQRTKDNRVQALIVTMALIESSKDKGRMREWFRLSKQILSTNAMPGFGETSAMPSDKVKECALMILKELIPVLSEGNLNTGSLDDLMTSTIQAIESNVFELHAVAYPLLGSIVETFKDRMVDDNNLLSLYESQFSIAARSAFPASVDLAASFIVDYIKFCVNGGAQHSSAIDLIEAVANGLTRAISYGPETPGFFLIASKVIECAQNDESVFEKTKPLLIRIAPVFERHFLFCMELRCTTNNWQDLSFFRKEYSPSYVGTLPATVWLRTISTQSIPLDVVLSFAIMECRTSSEGWRVQAGVGAVTEAIKLFPKQISRSLGVQAVKAGCHAIKRLQSLLKDIVSIFVEAACALQYNECARELTYVALTSKLSAKALGSFIASTSVEESADLLAAVIVCHLCDGDINEDQAAALMVLVLECAPNKVNAAVQMALRQERVYQFPRFCFSLIKRSLKFKTPLDVGLVAEVARRHIKDGGVELCAELMLADHSMGLSVAACGVLAEAFEKTTSAADLTVLLKFLELAKIDDDKVARRTAEKTIEFGGDRTIGKEIAGSFARVIRNARQIDSETARMTKAILEPHTTAAAVPLQPVKVTLMTFGTGAGLRRRQQHNDEWQDLEMDLSDSD